MEGIHNQFITGYVFIINHLQERLGEVKIVLQATLKRR